MKILSLALAAALPALLALTPNPKPAQSPTASDTATADRLFNDEDWVASAAAHAALARMQPDNAQFQLRLGIALHGLGRYAEATAALEVAERSRARGQPRLSGWPKPARAPGGSTTRAGPLLRAAERGFFAFPLIEGDPDLAGVRASAGFAEVRQAIDCNAAPASTRPSTVRSTSGSASGTCGPAARPTRLPLPTAASS